MSENCPQCPGCGGYRSHKNGNNFLDSGFKVQRWYCPVCRKTFQELVIRYTQSPRPQASLIFSDDTSAIYSHSADLQKSMTRSP